MEINGVAFIYHSIIVLLLHSDVFLNVAKKIININDYFVCRMLQYSS